MSYQSIGLGTVADDGTGDTLRVGGDKVNDNFVEIYTLLGTGTALCTGITADADDITFVGNSANVLWDKSDSALEFADNAKAKFGTGGDLEIYHDASHSYITDGGTGNLKIQGSQVDILGTSETMATFVDDGAVTLYYDNSARFATSSAGGTLTGTIIVSSNIEVGASVIFEGATADAYETTLSVTDPTADRTITLPNVTGTVITTGDTGTVNSTILADNSVDSDHYVDGSIDNAHLAADCVNGTKIADNAIDSEHYAADSIDEEHLANDCVGSAELKTLSTLLIKNSSGTTLKTCHCAGA